MGIGLRKQVQLIQVVSTKTAAGNWGDNTEGLKFGVWAEVADLSNDRRYTNGQTKLGDTKSFLIRFRFDKYPGADWKIRYDGRDYTISEKTKVDEKRFYWKMVGQCSKSQ